MNFLRMQKEFFRFRGELQNDSISGVNADEKQMCKDNLNRQIRRICDENPPFLKSVWTIRLRPAVDLDDSSSNETATGTKGIPQLVDSEGNLGVRHNFWTITDGTYRYRKIAGAGTTYTLDTMLNTTATTATMYTAYKDVFPLPHDCGNVITLYNESSNSPLNYLSSTAMNESFRHFNNTSTPRYYSLDSFSNRWNDYKFTQASVTFTNGTTSVSVGTTATDYDVNDVLLVDTATTAEYLHTIVGIDETNNLLYLDRNFEGTTGACTVYCNPKEHTRYITIRNLPDGDAALMLTGIRRPPDMVADTDECSFEEDLCYAVIVGALLEDQVSRQFVPEATAVWHNDLMMNLRHYRESRNLPTTGLPLRGGMFDWSTRGSQMTFNP